MYTLRIIDQSKGGAEQRRNFYLGNNYNVIIKVPIRESDIVESYENPFNLVLAEYYGIKKENIEKELKNIDESIVGFVYSEKLHPIRDFEVVYIVNSEGKTIERVRGIYEKY